MSKNWLQKQEEKECSRETGEHVQSHQEKRGCGVCTEELNVSQFDWNLVNVPQQNRGLGKANSCPK